MPGPRPALENERPIRSTTLATLIRLKRAAGRTKDLARAELDALLEEQQR